MSERKTIGIFLPQSLAREGFEFVFLGPSSACESCPLSKQCVKKLTVGRRYKVVEIIKRESALPMPKKCLLTDEPVVSVLVESSEFEVNLEKTRAIPGVTFTFEYSGCSYYTCPQREYCNYEGIPKGAKVEVVQVLEEVIECPQGKPLKRAVIRIKERFLMDLLLRFLIGILQGVFERLPISSSGVITLLLIALGEDPAEALRNAFFLHLGTALAATVYFRWDIYELLNEVRALKLSEYRKLLGLSLSISALVAVAILRFLFIGLEELGYVLIGAMLIVTGAILELTRPGSMRITKEAAIAAGVAQGLAVIPGLSRSGLTIAALSLFGVEGEEALKFSFLLSIPASLGAALLIGFPGISLGPIIGAASSFFFGYLTIGALIRLSRKIRRSLFLFLLGAITIGFYALA